jgi:hypothetical protein
MKSDNVPGMVRRTCERYDGDVIVIKDDLRMVHFRGDGAQV